MLKKLTPIGMMVLILFTAACFGGGGSDAPPGYSLMNSAEEDGLITKTYTGNATESEALSTFTEWLGQDGWMEADLGEAGHFIEQIGAYAGHWFVRDDVVLMMTIMEAGPTVTVNTVTETEK